MFWRPKVGMKGKCYVLSGYKKRNNVCLVYLETKLQQDSYGWCIFNLKIALPTKEPRTVCVFSAWEPQNKQQKQVNSTHKAKTNVRMTCFEVKM